MADAALSVPTHRRSRKAMWFSLHGWFALPIWGFLAFICVTGTLSVLSEEITWLTTPEIRASKPDENADVSYAAIIASVHASYAGAEIRSIQITQAYITSLVRITMPDGSAKRLHVNQYTGKIQGEMTGTGFRGFILALHGWLLFPWQDDYNLGWYLVCALSIPLLGSIISGLIVFKHFYRVIFRPTLRFSMGRRVFWGDLHRLVAAWSIWFAILISMSGLWFLVQAVLDQNHINIRPDKVRLHQPAVSTTETVIANKQFNEDLLDSILAQTKSTFPDLHITYLEFPEESADTLLMYGKRDFSILRDNANSLNFNPANGDLVASWSASDLSALQWLPALFMPLHFGDFAGLTSKIIWFFFGCLVSILVSSGFFIWSKRTFNTTRQSLKKVTTSVAINGSSQAISQRKHHDRQRKNVKRIAFWASWLIMLVPVYFFFQ